MARSGKQPTKKGKLTQMPSADGTVALEDVPKTANTPFDDVNRHDPPGNHPTPPPVAAQPVAPTRTEAKQPAPSPTFWDRVRRIPKEDWGTRVYMYLYCFEPICNEKISGEKKYLNRYDQPIYDEQAVMVDFGSGKYRLVLTWNKPTDADKGKPIEVYDFEIYNLKYPPKIPKAVWRNDTRNARWEALLPKEEPPHAAATAAGFSQFTDVLRATNEMRREIREELAPAVPPSDRLDPFASSLSIAREILQIRSDNPMVDVLRDELKGLREEMREERAANRSLQEELRRAQAPAAAAAAEKPKTLLEQATELADAAGKLKTIFNGPDENIIPRGKISPWQVARDVIPEIANSKIMEAVAAKMMAGPTAMPPMNGNGAQPRQNSTIPPLARFIENVGTPAMLEYFNAEGSGSDFADWLYSGFPTILPQLQGFTHPALPGLVGAPAIVQAYKNTPNVWPQLASREAQFIEFINEFCQWRPDADEEEQAKAEPDDDGWTQGSERGPEHEERVP